MRSLEYHRDDQRLWIGGLAPMRKRPCLAIMDGSKIDVVAYFKDEASAIAVQEILALFLTGQSADKAVRNV